MTDTEVPMGKLEMLYARRVEVAEFIAELARRGVGKPGLLAAIVRGQQRALATLDDEIRGEEEALGLCTDRAHGPNCALQDEPYDDEGRID